MAASGGIVFRNTRQTNAKGGGRQNARRLIAAAALIAVGVVASPATAAAQHDRPVTVSEHDGVYTVAATFTVTEAASFAIAALTDYSQIPRFMPEVRMSTVLERSDDRTVVEQEAVARFMMFSKRVHLVLEVQEAPGVIRFRDRCGKSFARYEGAWTIAERDGHTHITYELSATPSFDVPEFLLKRLLKRDAVQMIERLKTEIEARARQPVK
jgi:ribosome-associated toxin RatA of RatAB toxin-antitoxin module